MDVVVFSLNIYFRSDESVESEAAYTTSESAGSDFSPPSKRTKRRAVNAKQLKRRHRADIGSSGDSDDEDVVKMSSRGRVGYKVDYREKPSDEDVRFRILLRFLSMHTPYD